MKRLFHLKNKRTNQVLAHHLLKTTTLLERMKGLLFQRSFGREKALWIDPCFSVHTFFMSFPIDAVFVDSNLHVKAIYIDILPWRMICPPVWSVRSVFEFTGGSLKEKAIHIGDQLDVVS